MLVKSIESQKEFIKRKISIMDKFKGKKYYSAPRAFKANYVPLDFEPLKLKFEQGLSKIPNSSPIKFSDYVGSFSPKNKLELFALVLTDKHLFLLDAKAFKAPKTGPIDIKTFTEIQLTTGPDTYLVLRAASPNIDLVLDMGFSGGEDRYSEFVDVLTTLNPSIKLVINETIDFNNTRNAKKPGTDFKLKAVGVELPTRIGCKIKVIKKNPVMEIEYKKNFERTENPQFDPQISLKERSK